MKNQMAKTKYFHPCKICRVDLINWQIIVYLSLQWRITQICQKKMECATVVSERWCWQKSNLPMQMPPKTQNWRENMKKMCYECIMKNEGFNICNLHHPNGHPKCVPLAIIGTEKFSVVSQGTTTERLAPVIFPIIFENLHVGLKKESNEEGAPRPPGFSSDATQT